MCGGRQGPSSDKLVSGLEADLAGHGDHFVEGVSEEGLVSLGAAVPRNREHWRLSSRDRAGPREKCVPCGQQSSSECFSKAVSCLDRDEV